MEYVARLSYRPRRAGRDGHGRVIELRLVPPGGRAVDVADVRAAVIELAQGSEPDGWRVVRLNYGPDDAAVARMDAAGGAKNVTPDELGGLLSLVQEGDIVEVGREDRDGEDGDDD